MPLSEFQIISHYFDRHRVERSDVVLGIGDDAALVTVPEGMELAIAVDALIADRHFPADTSPANIGYKALAVNLSDMAAMGAEPAWLTLALSLPASDEHFLSGFAAGLFELAGRWGVQLIGGDTVRGPLMASVQIHGFVPAGKALRRDGAKPGDKIYVTGTLGDAGAGLQLFLGQRVCAGREARDYLIERLERPSPRLEAGLLLREYASAAIDISDGLEADLGHILERSGVGASISVTALPLSDALCACVVDRGERQQLALGAGDDYELCFTVPPEKEALLLECAGALPCPITCIGVIEAEPGLRLSGLSVDKRHTAGFDHFSPGSESDV